MDRDEKLILNSLLSSQRRANYISAMKNLYEVKAIERNEYINSMRAIIEQEGFKCPLASDQK